MLFTKLLLKPLKVLEIREGKTSSKLKVQLLSKLSEEYEFLIIS